MSELSRVAQLYQSNLSTLVALQTQLQSMETQLDTADTYKQVIKENMELRDKRNQLTQRLTELQLMQGEVHVPLPEETPCPPSIIFPQKRACEFSQSESEPSPKLDKRESTENPRQPTQRKTEVAKIAADRPTGPDTPAGPDKPRGAERPKGEEKPKGTDKPKGAESRL